MINEMMIPMVYLPSSAPLAPHQINKPTLVQTKRGAETKAAETDRLNENIDTPF
jgi:hypothetical protein